MALQEEIDEYLADKSGSAGGSIRVLDDPEVSDISKSVEICAVGFGSENEMSFHFVTPMFLSWALKSQESIGFLDDPDVFTSGTPLICVAQISGSSVVRGVQKYIRLSGMTL